MLFSKIIEKKFDAVLGRYEMNPAQFYFSADDFKGLHSDPFDVHVHHEERTLHGYFYYYNNFNPSKIVIFDHGIGSGYLAYMKEIEYLAKNGFTVYSYDHTGCVSTGGKGITGFAQGVNDLDCVLQSLKRDSHLKQSTFRLVGHSWGGYSSMNAAQFHPEVTHIVSLAGFLSARSLIEQYIPKMFLKYSEEVMQRERNNNPKYADLDARESLKKTDAKLFHIQSTDDKKVLFNLCYTLLEEALADRENTTLVKVENRNHEPHHTDRAVALDNRRIEEEATLLKKKKLSTQEERNDFINRYDWNIITEQDPVIWNQILNFLEQ